MAVGDRIQTSNNQDSASPLALTISTPTSGNIGVIAAGETAGAGANVPSVPAGWNLLKSSSGDTTNFSYGVWWKLLDGTEGTSISLTYGAGSSYGAAFVEYEWGLGTPTVQFDEQLGQINVGDGGASSCASGTLTPSNASSNLCVAAWVMDRGNFWLGGGEAVTNSFTIDQNIAGTVRPNGVFASRLNVGTSISTTFSTDDADLGSSAFGGLIVFNEPGADTTAPTYDATPSLNATQTRNVTINVDASDEASATVDHYGVLVPAADSTPSAAQVKAGQDSTGSSVAAGLADSSTGITSGVATTLDFTNVPVTAMKACVMVDDADDNASSVQTVSIPALGSSTVEDSNVLYETTVENLQSQTTFGLATAAPDDTQIVGCVFAISKSGADENFTLFRATSFDATGGAAERLVTGVKASSGYTIANGDRVRVYAAYPDVVVATNGIDSGSLTTAAIAAINNGMATEADIDALENISVAEILTTAMTESYAADGAAPTLTQAILAIQQRLLDAARSGTTLTVRQLDGTTTAMTIALDDATDPTSISRTG